MVSKTRNPEPGTRNPDISCFLPGAPPLADVKNRLPMSGAVYREVLVWVNYGR
ncbi:MAG TPA: hypothetical protein PLB18_06030 [Acidobacteriota bacterium]|nr:hypothetical protein [Acidobacteriota bacterium]